MPYIQRLLIGFCAGGLCLGLPWPGGPELPGVVALAAAWGLGGVAVAGCAARCRRAVRPPALLIGALAGLAWSAAAHDRALASRLGPEQRDDVVLVGLVTGRPQPIEGFGGEPGVRFEVRVLAGPGPVGGRRLRLGWIAGPPLAEGEVWRLRASLRGPWGFANPAGFDVERWQLGRRLDGSGWVRAGERRRAAAAGPLARLRSAAAGVLEGAGLDHPDVARALLLGHGDAVGDGLWESLRRTGTVHLLVISGLHVSLAASLGFLVGGAVVRLWPPLLLRLDARRAGCAGGTALASAYLLLAEGELPALRAALMSAAVLWLLAGGRRSSAGPLLLAALAVLLLLEPLAVHRLGFWLSFAAVGMLLLVLGSGDGGPLRRLAQVQLGLSVGLLPAVAALTGTVPWLSVPANLLAVPLVGLVVVPGLFLGLALSPVWEAGAGAVLAVADGAVALTIGWIDRLAAVEPPPVAAGGGALALAQTGTVLLWLGVARRHLPAVGLAVLLFLAPAGTAIPWGAFRVTALDVGQGSAVVVETRRHRLLFDAGPAHPAGLDTGAGVVVPSLSRLGRRPLDLLILSHADVDHVGGAGAVIRALAPRRIWSGGDGSLVADGACHGRRWRWDGVDFRLLRVPRPRRASDNDRSCVLLVDDGRARMLIAGDVGVAVEARLIRALAPMAPLDLLFAPHHGSRSSSSRAFVRVLRPQRVFVSVGRNNRFGHPHAAVTVRYRAVGATLYRTGWDGALVWNSRSPERVVRWRRDRLPYWRAAWTPAPGAS